MEKDQAQNLRDAIERKKTEPKVFCISSGKGGVGKSNFALNLGIELDNRGKKVVIIDADIGLANLEILLGIVSKYSLLDIIKRDMKLEEIITNGPGELKFISGGSGISELADIESDKLDKFISSISSLEKIADIILIDTGAGISQVVTSFAKIAHEMIIVTTTEPTAIADAYALIKVLTNKNINKKINIVINRADTEKEAKEIYSNLEAVSNKFLNTKLENLGYVLNDKNVAKAVKIRKPFITEMSSSKASKCIRKISSKILDQTQKTDGNLTGFISKFKTLFK